MWKTVHSPSDRAGLKRSMWLLRLSRANQKTRSLQNRATDNPVAHGCQGCTWGGFATIRRFNRCRREPRWMRRKGQWTEALGARDAKKASAAEVQSIETG